METYTNFMMTLAMGLFGMSIILKVLLDGIFNEWDAVADINHLMKNGLHLKQTSTQRAEDVMLELEKARMPTLTTKNNIYEQKRHMLEELSAVEDRVSQAPVVLTPIMPSASQNTSN
jgi:hypothetical protein